MLLGFGWEASPPSGILLFLGAGASSVIQPFYFNFFFFLRFGHIQGVNGGGACASLYLWCFQQSRAVLRARCPPRFSLQSQKIKVMEIILLLG